MLRLDKKSSSKIKFKNLFREIEISKNQVQIDRRSKNLCVHHVTLADGQILKLASNVKKIYRVSLPIISLYHSQIAKYRKYCSNEIFWHKKRIRKIIG